MFMNVSISFFQHLSHLLKLNTIVIFLHEINNQKKNHISTNWSKAQTMEIVPTKLEFTWPN